MNQLTIYNDRSIQILDGVLYSHLIEEVSITMPRGSQGFVVTFFPYGEDDPVMEATIPPGAPMSARESVWRSMTKHLGRSLREIKESDAAPSYDSDQNNTEHEIA